MHDKIIQKAREDSIELKCSKFLAVLGSDKNNNLQNVMT